MKNASGTVSISLNKSGKMKLVGSTHSLIKDPTGTVTAMEWVWTTIIWKPLKESLHCTGTVVEISRNDQSRPMYRRQTECNQCKKTYQTEIIGCAECAPQRSTINATRWESAKEDADHQQYRYGHKKNTQYKEII